MKPYNSEDFKIDCEWLRGQGVCTHELEELILSIVKRSSIMTTKEVLELVEELE